MMKRRSGTALATAVLGAGAMAGCASVIGSTESTVKINTNPPSAICELKGRGDFRTKVVTPASLDIPTAASPVMVTCSAPGRRPTTYNLDATADGWTWANSALVVVSGGAAVLGLLVDESRDAGKSYRDTVTYDLDSGMPRELHATDRHGGQLNLRSE